MGEPFRAEGCTYSNVEIGAIGGELVGRSGMATNGLIIYFHGGGFVLGSSKSHRIITSLLCQLSGHAVLVPDYRLAPEFIAPAAHQDAYAAYLWALGNGYPAKNIALSGDSAGGNLALSAAVRARNEGYPLPFAIALLSPAVDFTASGASHRNVSDDPVLSESAMKFFISTYLGDNRPEIAKSLTRLDENLFNLPPTLIHVGSRERLLDDSVTLAKKLCDAGVETEFKTWSGMFHVWQNFALMLDEGMSSLKEVAQFFKNKMAENNYFPNS